MPLQMSELDTQLRKRLTFAIISHPDSGKTTITEKLLLFGGAIHIAGAVKSGKNSKNTVSDFMSRSPSMADPDYAGILSRLAARGYRTADIQIMQQVW